MINALKLGTPEYEICSFCGEPTGKAGRCEDSLYLQEYEQKQIGPLCQDCYDETQKLLD